MLLNFKVSNFRSIDEPIELNLVSNRSDDASLIHAGSVDANVVSKAVIFGPNAAGKTNILLAYQWLVEIIKTSLYQWADGIPTQPFAFRDGERKPSTFAIELEIESVLYRYEVSLDGFSISHEELNYWPSGRRKLLFRRTGLELKASREFGSTKGPKSLLTKNVLVVSIAKKYEMGPVTVFAEMVQDVLSLDLFTGLDIQQNFGDLPRATRTSAIPLAWFKDEPEQVQPKADFPLTVEARKSKALELLRMADPGIQDVSIEDSELEQITPDGRRHRALQRKVRLEHEIAGESAYLDLQFESRGTNKWLAIISPLLTALEFGSLILIDEMDSSLHPLLFEKILEVFGDKKLNTKGAQLLITSHNSSLLSELAVDEVWFAEKNQSGSTTLFSLLDFRASQIDAPARRSMQYLDGRFGAVPQVDTDIVLDQFSSLANA